MIRKHEFTVPGEPMGKPRMTKRDKWAKRDVVLRYRAYCDRIRAAAKQIPAEPLALLVIAYFPMPPSWSAKKQEAMVNRMHQQKPDYDNVAKAVGDALFEDDSVIGTGTTTKFWVRAGEERTVIAVLFEEKQQELAPCSTSSSTSKKPTASRSKPRSVTTLESRFPWLRSSTRTPSTP